MRFDHVAVSTTNLEATLAFYERSFGFQAIGQLFYDDDPRGLTITMLGAGGEARGFYLHHTDDDLSMGARRGATRACAMWA